MTTTTTQTSGIKYEANPPQAAGPWRWNAWATGADGYVWQDSFPTYEAAEDFVQTITRFA